MLESIFRSFVDDANEYVWETPETLPWLVALLLGSGIFITFRMGWINVRQLPHAINVIRGKYDDPNDEGDINHFQALTTALSATVGIGNIAGVATAIHYGGPGVLLWMWLSGIFGMTLKYAECALSMHYRTFDDLGNASGGPMYYIEKGLGSRWKWMAIAFAFLAMVSSFGSGNMNQANSVAVSAAADFKTPDWMVGMILAVLVGLVILGGIRRIGAVSSRLMPTMAILYALGAVVILMGHVPDLPAAFTTIVNEAFSPRASLGGTAAGIWHLTMLWGIKRALFSNEAGQGSAPIAHAAAKTKEPVREGAVAMVGPLIDTLSICTLTGLVIVVTGVWDQKHPEELELDLDKIEVYVHPGEGVADGMLHDELNPLEEFEGTTQVVNGSASGLLFATNDGIIDGAELYRDDQLYTGRLSIKEKALKGEDGANLSLDIHGMMVLNSSALTARAFRVGMDKVAGLGSLGNLIVTLSVFLFGFSTMVSWSYYGDRCVEYLFGVRYVTPYRIVYVMFTFTGAILALETVWAYGDLALGLMTVPNLIAVVLLSPKLVSLTREYFSREHTQLR